MKTGWIMIKMTGEAPEIRSDLPDICHRHHRHYLWRKICHVEKFLHMTNRRVEKFSTWQIVMWRNSPQDRILCGEILHMKNCHVEKVLHMRNVKKFCNEEKKCVLFMALCRFFAVLLQNLFFLQLTPSCREICIVAKKRAFAWRKVEKITNIRYALQQKKSQVTLYVHNTCYFTFCLCLEVTPLFGSNTKLMSNYFSGKKNPNLLGKPPLG